MPTYTFNVYRCDNRIVAQLNNQTMYEKYTDHDPALSDSVDITDMLNPWPTQNHIIVSLYNGPSGGPINPYNFHYQIKKDAAVVVDIQVNSGGATAPAGLVGSHDHTIVKEQPLKH